MQFFIILISVFLSICHLFSALGDLSANAILPFWRHQAFQDTDRFIVGAFSWCTKMVFNVIKALVELLAVVLAS